MPQGRSSKHPIVGLCNLLVGVSLLYVVWVALPARWLPVDVGVSALAGLLVLAGVALLVGGRVAKMVALPVAVITLVVGALLCTALLVTGAELVGLYGPVGRGAAIILSIGAAVAIPYLVAFPAAQLYILLGNKGQ